MTHSNNPYPGPRSFQTGEKLYGRQAETWGLLDLLIAERIVLFYSPSGAGKTSLIQAALLPELEDEGYRVLPIMRPGLETEKPAPTANRYVLSLLLSLEKDLPEAEQTPLADLAQMTLADYLARIDAGRDDRGVIGDWYGDVLVFDQFEEVLTVDPTDREAKTDFFRQVGEVLRDPNRWALFSMREEFVAGLDPYLRALPTRFTTKYRLELLGADAAKAAMQEPAKAENVDFTAAAAAHLIDDLRAVRVQQPDGSTQTIPGHHVEPVQLQVVCRRLWDRLDTLDDGVINVDDLDGVGDVDMALRSYYADSVAKIATETGVPEHEIREWVGKRLITEQGIRDMVLMEPEGSGGLPNDVIERLKNIHLVRAEYRRGATWFELTHDRLINPVIADNATWYIDTEWQALGQATAALQHRLNTTLANALPAIMRLQNRYCDDTETVEMLEMLARNTRYALQITQRQKMWFLGTVDRFEAGSINDLLRNAIEEHVAREFESPVLFDVRSSDGSLSVTQPTYKGNQTPIKIRLTFKPGAQMPLIALRAKSMQEVLNILLENAIKSIMRQKPPTNGEIRISSRFFEDASQHDMARGTIEITVTDNGIGFSTEKLERLNSGLIPRRDLTEGAGMGLWLSHIIIRNHKGKIVAYSDGEGKGVTFTISLPVLPTPSARPSALFDPEYYDNESGSAM